MLQELGLYIAAIWSSVSPVTAERLKGQLEMRPLRTGVCIVELSRPLCTVLDSHRVKPGFRAVKPGFRAVTLKTHLVCEACWVEAMEATAVQLHIFLKYLPSMLGLGQRYSRTDINS